MKNGICVCLCIAVLLGLSGCGSGNTGNRTANQTVGVNEVLNAGMAEADASGDEPVSGAAEQRQSGVDPNAPVPSANGSSETSQHTEGIDVDLTALSSTMVYSEVYTMMTSPENYIGKTVKMRGAFGAYHDETTDQYYFSCVISDALACCAQGIEFVLTDEYRYPDDYPKEGADITVVGVFDTYLENGNTYCTLQNAALM